MILLRVRDSGIHQCVVWPVSVNAHTGRKKEKERERERERETERDREWLEKKREQAAQSIQKTEVERHTIGVN